MLGYKTKTKRETGSTTVQPKLKIGQPGDKYEQEADAVADRVMRMSDSNQVQMQPIEEEEEIMQPKLRMQPMEEEEEELVQPQIQRQEEEEEAQAKIQMQPMEEEEEMLQTKASNRNVSASESLSENLNLSKGKGLGLLPKSNQFMSNALGTDFSGVKIHTRQNAVEMNQSLNARAFTHGSDIYFNKGEYNPESSRGKRLLAHELTHVVHQTGNKAKVVQKQDPEPPTQESPAQQKVPFTLASLDNTWHQIVNNFINWAMRGLEQANLPADTPGKVFSRGLANDFAWITVGLAANLAGPIGGPAVAMAKSLIDRKKEEIKLWTASKFSTIKAIIRKRLTRLSTTWKQPALKFTALQRVLNALGPNADMNNKDDVSRRRKLVRAELTGRANDTDAAISERIRVNVQDRWAYFKEAVAIQKNLVREARRKEGFLHFIKRGINGVGYWDKDDDSPGLNMGDAMKMPKGYTPPSRRGPAIRSAR